MTFEDLSSAISSAEFWAGPMPSSLQDGQKINRAGPARAPVSHSLRRVNEKAKPTNGTSGLPGSDSLMPSDHLSFLVSKSLQRRLSGGLMEYLLTWKVRITPAGRSIYALRASKLHTSVNGCSGWPIAAARDWKDGRSNQHGRNARPLNEVATLAGWQTPKCPSGGGQMDRMTTGGGVRKLEDQVLLAGWCSPTAQDGSRGGLPPRPQDTGVPLSQQVALAGWITPGANKWGEPDSHGKTVLGPITTSSPVQTAKLGVLNPAHSRWLQGFPIAWCQAAIRAYRMHKPRRRRG